MVDVAVLERAACESDLLGVVIEQERTSYEGTLVEAAKLHTTAEIKRFGVKRLVPDNPFVDSARHLCRLLLRRFCDLSEAFRGVGCATQQPEQVLVALLIQDKICGRDPLQVARQFAVGVG